MAKKVYVKPHRWKPGRTGTHPGYWRNKRPKGKMKIRAKPLYVKIDRYVDEYGQFRPERKWRMLKRRNV